MLFAPGPSGVYNREIARRRIAFPVSLSTAMISSARPTSSPVADGGNSVQGSPPPREISAYDRRFWLAYSANLLAMLTVVLLYRYADLVSHLGGGPYELGWIVGVGMMGVLPTRFVLGGVIDRYGAHRVWMASLVAMAASCFAHLTLTTCHGPGIFLLRLLFAMSVAGTFASVMIWIGDRVPDVRLSEMFAMLGSGGFIAMVIGSFVGDWLAGATPGSAQAVRRMLLAAGCMSVAAVGLAWLAGWGLRRIVHQRRRPLLLVLRRYHSVGLAVISLGSGMALTLAPTFLRPFTAELGIGQIAVFFTAYALTALVGRVITRRWAQRIGLRAMILLGTVVTAVAVALLATVHSRLGLIPPAVVLGVGHAILLPPVFAAGSQTFPRRYRGTGVMFIMAAYDLGTLIGAPLAGAILRFSPKAGLAPYPTMFLTVAGLLIVLGACYALLPEPSRPRRRMIRRNVRVDSRQPILVPASEPSVQSEPAITSGSEFCPSLGHTPHQPDGGPANVC
ncbi:MAG: MFS transporter [Pirellulales bacterium]|nr:MFS transporter [Pirellulales bacterium]